MSEVADKVKKIIAEHLGIDDMSKITDDRHQVKTRGRWICCIALSITAARAGGSTLS